MFVREVNVVIGCFVTDCQEQDGFDNAEYDKTLHSVFFLTNNANFMKML